MKELPLRDRLLRYFKNHHTEWIPSGTLQRLVVNNTKHTPRSAVRRLQEMHEDGLLERKLVKNHTHYKLKETTQYPTPQALQVAQEGIRWFDSYVPSV